MMVRAAAQTVALAASLAALLFGFSGTLRWIEAWVLVASMVAIGMATSGWLMARDPDLLKARLSSPMSADQTPAVRILIALVGVGFFLWIAAIGLDHRVEGRRLPLWAEGLGAILIALGVALVCCAFAANSFAAPQVRVLAERGQTVIETGLYGVIRHPMYAGADLFLLGVAMLLGSGWGLVGAALLILGVCVRAVGEEAVLRDGLGGYIAYSERVRFRIFPRLW